jgi:hypothetical protein
VAVATATLVVGVVSRGRTVISGAHATASTATHTIATLDLFFCALATGCARRTTDTGTGCSTDWAANQSAYDTACDCAAGTTGTRAAHVIVAIIFGSISRSSTTGSTYACANGCTDRTAYHCTHDSTSHGTTGTAHCFVGLVVAATVATASTCRAVAVVRIAVEFSIAADVTCAVLVEEVTYAVFLAVRHACRHEHSTALNTCLIQARLFLGNACVNECADQATRSRADTGADKCCGERACCNYRAYAWDSECANTDEKAGKTTKHTAADGTCNGPTAATICSFNFSLSGLSA